MYSILENKAKHIRADLLKMIHNANAGHTGGALSSVDILVSLYYQVMKNKPEDPAWPERDIFILSKGHSCEGLYSTLAHKGYIDLEELSTFSRYGSRLTGHPTRDIPGVEVNTGALGHGLSVGVGMAMAAKMDGRGTKVFVLLGDGELGEGSVWEAALAAGSYNLDSLVAIIDRNQLQISGRTEEVLRLEPLKDKWEAFGWNVREVDGHDYSALVPALENTPWEQGKPNLLIADTIKGYGVTFMQDQAGWHHRVPTAEELQLALEELLGGVAQ